MRDDRLELMIDTMTAALVSVGILPKVDDRGWPPGTDGTLDLPGLTDDEGEPVPPDAVA